jgi:hypothetical protein
MALLKAAGRLPAPLLLIGLSLIGGADALAQIPSPSEYQVKAVFLYRFASFVEWPEAVSRGPLCIGLLGRDPFGNILDDAVKGKSISGRAFEIRRFKTVQQARDCHIVFISASEAKRLPAILEELRGRSVLTVSETPKFCLSGGVINFELVEDSVRLEINLDAAERAGLRMSSKILGVARVVRGAGH